MSLGKTGLMSKIRQNTNGFTLMEVVIAVGLLALVSTVSVSVVTNLLRSAVKSQAGVDIEQTSNFVLLKLKNDLNKAVSVTVASDTLTINQGSTLGSVSYSILPASDPANCGLPTKVTNCIRRNTTLLTDSTDRSSAVSVEPEPGYSMFSGITDAEGRVIAVNIVMKFKKPDVSGPAGGSFSGESTLNTTIALPAI